MELRGRWEWRQRQGLLLEPILCPGIHNQGQWFIEALYFKIIPFHGRSDKTGGSTRPLGRRRKDFFYFPMLSTQGSLKRRPWEHWHALLQLSYSQGPLPTIDKALVYAPSSLILTAGGTRQPVCLQQAASQGSWHIGGLGYREWLWGRWNEAHWSLVSPRRLS